MRVLLIEDDPSIGETVAMALKDAAYAVDWVHDGPAALAAAGSQHYDIALLDLGLPKLDGVAVLDHLRRTDNTVPVIVLTARDGLAERVRCLDSGADDFLVKPFMMAELLARIRAVSRRRGGAAGPILSNGIISLDPASREARTSETVVRLSAREFALLLALMHRPGAILSRAELEDRIYGWNEEVESNAVEFLIHSLRKKLGNNAIKNVRGVGWMVSRSP